MSATGKSPLGQKTSVLDSLLVADGCSEGNDLIIKLTCLVLKKAFEIPCQI